MDSQALIIFGALVGLVGFGVLCVAFRFRGSNVLLFAALLLPNVWLNRFNTNMYGPYRLSFPNFWAVLVLIILVSFVATRTRTAQLFTSARRRLGVSMLLLLIALLASTIVNAEGKEDMIRGLHATCFVILPFLAAWRILQCCEIDEARISRAATAILLVGAFVALLSVLAAVSPGSFAGIVTTYKTHREEGRAFTPLGGPSAVAMCLLAVYCLAAGLLLARRQRLLSLLVMGLCFLGILTTLARAALIAFFIANFYLYAHRFAGLGRRLTILIATTLAVLLPAVYWLSKEYSLERFGHGLEAGQDSSIEIRMVSLKTAIRYGMHHLPFGGGWGRVYTPARERGTAERRTRELSLDGLPSAAKPHSLFGLVFAEGGVALLFLLLFFWQVWRCMGTPDVRSYPEAYNVVHGFRAGLVSFLALSVAQDHLYYASQIAFFMYLFILTGIAASAYYRSLPVPGLVTTYDTVVPQRRPAVASGR